MIEAIGHVVCPYKDKFGVPRQPHLVTSVEASIEISTTKCAPESFSSLEGFNFIWIIGVFHQAKSNSSKVRPPRLGGNEKVGVFASRSPFRPNPISLSLVKLVAIEHDEKRKMNILRVEGIDLINGTPILDIKPYIALHDTPWETAKNGWLENQDIKVFDVSWNEKALEIIAEIKTRKMVEDILRYDPRPAFHHDEMDKTYHFLVDDFDIEFTIKNAQVIILNAVLLNR